MKVLNLSTLKLNDHHSYYGGAIGNIAYELLAHLARQDGVEVFSLIEDADLQAPPPDGLHLYESGGLLADRRHVNEALPGFDVATHLYFHEPEYSPLADLPAKHDTPLVVGMVEAPHRRFADERSGLEAIGPVRRLGKAVARRLHRRAWARADRAIYVTDHARRYYRERYPTPGADPVVPYGVDTDRFTPGNGGGSPRVLVVSRLIRRRGVRHLIDALPAIADAEPDVRVDIVGSGEQRRPLVERAEARGVAERVTFHGNVDATHLADLYREAGVLCHLSADDGFNQPALEAMASGTPVVATDAGHNPMVVDGETGRRVPWGDAEAVADAVVAVLGDGRLGRRARALVEREYGWPRVARRYAAVLRGVVGKETATVS